MAYRVDIARKVTNDFMPSKPNGTNLNPQEDWNSVKYMVKYTVK
jgi:hypothetical protein